MRYLTDIEWIDERGFAICREIQVDGSNGEYGLFRMILSEDGKIILSAETIMNSKFRNRLLERYQKELKNDKHIIMDIMETLKGLTVRQLESLKPSYYNLAIDRKIAELKGKREKKEKNADTKTKRSTKKAVKVTSRSRNIQA